MPEENLTLEIYEGDGEWQEGGSVSAAQMINDSAVTLLGYTFGDREDWFQRSFALFEIYDEDKLQVTFTASAADLALLRENAVRVFHHTVVRG